MNYTVGNYNIGVAEPFKDYEEAVSLIQNNHPELSKDDIVKYLKPKIKVNESDRSDGVPEQASEGEKGVAKDDKRGNRSERAEKNKSE